MAFTTSLPISPLAPTRQWSSSVARRFRVASPAPVRRRAVAHVAPRCALEPLILSEESVTLALDEARTTLGTLFDASVGITGEVELASLDGPIVVLRLSGRFWHKRTDVFARVSAYLEQRIPELCGVEIEDEAQFDDHAE